MAGGDEMLGAGSVNRVGAALLFIGAGTNVYDAFSAVMSSPWSTEKFTNDSQEARMAFRYVRHAIAISWIYAIVGALLVRGTLWKWPVAGAAIVTAYMTYLYHGAISRGPTGDGMGSGDETAKESTQARHRHGSALGPIETGRTR